jgi:hypothetical protein
MKGALVAEAAWEALDRPGADTCRLWEEPEGWMLVGHVWFRDAGGEAILDYVVRCDRDWNSHSADVSGRVNGETVGWQIARNGERWRLNDAVVPGSECCSDVDLGFTPATNLLPIRRLDLACGQPREIRALWLRLPEGRAQVHPQVYERLADGRVRYASPGFSVDLDVHPSGFVTEYPEGWRGEVHAA